MVFPESLSIDTAPNLAVLYPLPFDTANAAIVWVPKRVVLRGDPAAAGARTVDIRFAVPGNAAFGAGTSALSASLTLAAGGFEIVSTTLAAVTAAAGGWCAATWSTVNGTAGGAFVEIEWEQQ